MIRILRTLKHKIENTVSYILFKLNKVHLGQNVTVNGIARIDNRGTFIIGNSVKLNMNYKYNPIGGERQMTFIIGGHGILHIKDNAGISNSAIYCKKEITIEEDVLIGGGCIIYDTDFHSIYYNDRILLDDINAKSAPVHIRKGAFIGGHTIILKGVTIGQYSVIGAGSVVTKDVPDNELWAGNPARFIKHINN